jgi:glutamyl-tRNA synthetase
MSSFRSRLAPTVSGFLHLGNAYSFLLTSQLVKNNKGKLFLRIDDADSDRNRTEFLKDIFDGLNFLGIEWDEGPRDEKDFNENYLRQNRMSLYMDALKKLIENGHVFACECSRKQLQHIGGRYPGTCEQKKIPINTPGTVLRMRVEKGTIVTFTDEHLGEQKINLDEAVGSFVILKRDHTPGYHLFSVIDDLHFKINFIVRGSDLIASSAAQVFLAEKLWNNDFYKTKFFHHILLPDELGQKLSKSEGALSLKTMREKGLTREDVLMKLKPLLQLGK